MTKRWPAALLCAAAASLAGAPATFANAHHTRAGLRPLAVQAPETPAGSQTYGDACTTPAVGTPAGQNPFVYPAYHCYAPADIVAHYGMGDVQTAADYGAGQTIVLVDAYGTPTGQQDIDTFWQAFYGGKAEFKPDLEQVYPQGKPDYKNTSKGNGQSGPSAAEGWAGEANLDIEWAYAMAPKAHIVLLAVPPAETEGVQGFPNLFKAMSAAVDKYPSGTIFSQSFGVTEETFGGAAATQTAKFDAVYKKGNAKGDTFLASSGDDGSWGVAKQHRESTSYDHPTVGWPASSPYVTAVGGTQIQRGWTWNPVSDQPWLTDAQTPIFVKKNPVYFQWDASGNDTDYVWNESWESIATGGGESLIYGRPDWQQDVTAIQGDHRGLPDVAWNAAVNGGVLTYQSFFPGPSERVGWHVYGGTSAASPQLAGVLALANAEQKAKGDDPVGYINPLLYRLPASAYTDVVPHSEGIVPSGQLDDNQIWDVNPDGTVSKDPVPGYDTTEGYDLTTGFGVPNGASFVSKLRAARNGP
jgi:subtilase family serine protease